jgi:integrase
VVQERVGHSSIGVTLDIYSHLIPTIQRMRRLALTRHISPR